MELSESINPQTALATTGAGILLGGAGYGWYQCAKVGLCGQVLSDGDSWGHSGGSSKTGSSKTGSSKGGMEEIKNGTVQGNGPKGNGEGEQGPGLDKLD